MKPIGVIQAGGRSVRYGSPKALAVLGGRTILQRVIDALKPVTSEIILVTNSPELFVDYQLPIQSDVLKEAGSLGGIHAGLVHVRDRGFEGALTVACDMPFLSSALLERIAQALDESCNVAAPESDGPRGIEPLCAAYSVACIAPIEKQVERGDLRVVGFFDEVRLHRIPLTEIRELGDPAMFFMNINTPDDYHRAEQLASEN